jgi:tRNA(Ile)-lysidine synthetase-like protein
MEKGRVPRPDPPVTLLARGHGVVFEIRGASGPARAADPAGPVSGTAEPAVSADAAGAAGTDAAGTAPEYGTAEAAADPGTALRLIARSDVAKATKKGYCVVLEDNFPFNSELLGLQIDKTLVSSKKGVCPRIDFEGLERPILVRSARPGDTIQLKEGKKRVRKLFQEWKIRSEDAWRVPILEDRGGVKAVLGSFAAGADRFAADIPSPNPKHSKTQLVFSKCGVNRSEFSE